MSIANTTVTGTGDTELVAAQAAGHKIGVMSVTFSNVGSADGYLILKDGTTERARFFAPAASGPYEAPKEKTGLVIPLGNMTAATALNASADAADVSFRVTVHHQARFSGFSY